MNLKLTIYHTLNIHHTCEIAATMAMIDIKADRPGLLNYHIEKALKEHNPIFTFESNDHSKAESDLFSLLDVKAEGYSLLKWGTVVKVDQNDQPIGYYIYMNNKHLKYIPQAVFERGYADDDTDIQNVKLASSSMRFDSFGEAFTKEEALVDHVYLVTIKSPDGPKTEFLGLKAEGWFRIETKEPEPVPADWEFLKLYMIGQADD